MRFCRISICVLLSFVAKEGTCLVCSGTRNSLSTSTRTDIDVYIKEYTGCTVVTYNVEINFYIGPHPDTSFLDSIEEVKGCIILVGNNFQNITMKNLKLVRGNYLYNRKSIFIEDNNKLDRVIFPSLKEILKGDVTIKDNPQLCFVNTIQWNDIVHESQTHVVIQTSDECDVNGKKCDESCESKSCWSESICQIFRLKSCSSDCRTGCLDGKPDACCSDECVAGCTGTSANCTGCRNFNDNGVCVNQCPFEMEFDETLSMNFPTRTSKLHYLTDCVDKCPPSTVQLFAKCVSNCPEKFYSSDNICKEQTNESVEFKTCKTTTYFTKENLKEFVNCTTIEGHFEILSSLKAEELLPYLPQFATIEVITGFLIVQGLGEEIDDLSFFKNLKKIRGHRADMVKNAAISIMMTKLKRLNMPLLERVENDRILIYKNELMESLDLPSLKYIHGSEKGVALIKDNKALCYVTNETFQQISETELINLSNNKDERECEIENKTCHAECSGGCWGPGRKQCRFCSNFLYNGECLESCNDYLHLYADGDKCKPCDPQCETGCYGAGPSNCTACLDTKYGRICPGSCVRSKYSDLLKMSCKDCSANCKNGCTGPRDTLEIGGCNNCHLMLSNSSKCLQKGSFDCAAWPGFIKYENKSALDSFGRSVYELVQVCVQCHHLCKKCTGEGNSADVCNCKYAEFKGACLDECPMEHFVGRRKMCYPWVWTYDNEAQVLMPGIPGILQNHM